MQRHPHRAFRVPRTTTPKQHSTNGSECVSRSAVDLSCSGHQATNPRLSLAASFWRLHRILVAAFQAVDLCWFNVTKASYELKHDTKSLRTWALRRSLTQLKSQGVGPFGPCGLRDSRRRAILRSKGNCREHERAVGSARMQRARGHPSPKASSRREPSANTTPTPRDLRRLATLPHSQPLPPAAVPFPRACASSFLLFWSFSPAPCDASRTKNYS